MRGQPALDRYRRQRAMSRPSSWNPVWSPDGRYLYFSRDRGGTHEPPAYPDRRAVGARPGPPEAITAPSPKKNCLRASGSIPATSARLSRNDFPTQRTDANHHDEYGGSEQRASKHNLAHDHAHLTSGRGPLEARDERRRPDPAGPFATKVHDGKARIRSLTFRRDSDEVDTESRFNLNAAGVEPSRSHASPL